MGSGCLSNEELLAFVEDRLSAQAVDATHAHMSECGHCRRLMSDVARYHFRSQTGASKAMTASGLSAIATAPDPAAARVGTSLASERDRTLAAGTMVSRYRILDTLGSGGGGGAWPPPPPR